MEKLTDETKTHDFMNVETFSQLPFIRPTPVVKEKGIRLFGIEFSGGDGEENAAGDDENNEKVEEGTSKLDDGNGGNSNNRRFECHYCCRNFPTSQALGGHQNAHKRERQHAKRVHLQTAAAASFLHGGVGGSSLIGYGRLVSPHSSPNNYNSPSWTRASSVFGNHHTYSGGPFSPHAPPPIIGSPMGLWRFPSSSSSLTLHGGHSGDIHQRLPLFSENRQPPNNNGVLETQNGYYDSKRKNVQDHVSLDLHL